MTRPHVVVFDPHQILAQALTASFAQRFDAAEATTSLELLRTTLISLNPLVVVLSLGSGPPDLFGTILSMFDTSIPEHVIVLSDPANRTLVQAALDAGVGGLVLASSDLIELHLAIEVVRRGKRYVSPAVAVALVEPQRRKPFRPLTRCQLRVMRMRQKGMKVTTIAAVLGQDVKNVGKRLSAGKRKFGAAAGERLDFSSLDLG